MLTVFWVKFSSKSMAIMLNVFIPFVNETSSLKSPLELGIIFLELIKRVIPLELSYALPIKVNFS